MSTKCIFKIYEGTIGYKLYIYINELKSYINKSQSFGLVDHMPDEFTEDDLFERVILMQKVERAKKQIEAGEF